MENTTPPLFLASIKERRLLTKPSSTKKTYHIVFDLKGSGFSYNAGDSLAVYPENGIEEVFEVLNRLKFSGEEVIVPKKSGGPLSLKEYLVKKANLKAIPRNLYKALHGEREDLKDFLKSRELIDILEPRLSPQELADSLLPQLPRFYSIASSQRVTKDEVHLTVGLVSYEVSGRISFGVCTNYLCRLAPLGEGVIPVYIQGAHDFSLPLDNSASLIMIGPGTGVAPFRGFMQERRALGAKGKHWLIFGERHKATDFFYEEEWQEYEREGILRVSTAFSRDQEKKLYVQDRLLEASREVFEWIQGGAYIYVCGDASRMAKQVEEALETIFCKEGGMTLEEAQSQLKHLRVVEKRYLKDVY
jgi:sulfite reductase (NADPH) flavoprotein alpha-component